MISGHQSTPRTPHPSLSVLLLLRDALRQEPMKKSAQHLQIQNLHLDEAYKTAESLGLNLANAKADSAS